MKWGEGLFMLKLSKDCLQFNSQQSSKGNQLKWKNMNNWYKLDYLGYESLAEFIVSHLLQYSTLESDKFVLYHVDRVKYNNSVFNCSVSADFLHDNKYQLITLERLHKEVKGTSLYKIIWSLASVKDRISALVDIVQEITGLNNFGTYLSVLLTIDALFLNEDRHFHNIAVLMNDSGVFNYCPIFDNGNCLLSDTTMDYPLSVDYMLVINDNKVQAKTISTDFDEQLDVIEKLYGRNIQFTFDKKDLRDIINSPDLSIYSKEEKERVYEIICQQMRKYSYLFKNKTEDIRTFNLF